MTRVRVDFNAVDAQGMLRGSGRRADDVLEQGALVELYDREEPEMIYAGRVAEYDPATGAALFEVDWESAALVRVPQVRVGGGFVEVRGVTSLAAMASPVTIVSHSAVITYPVAV